MRSARSSASTATASTSAATAACRISPTRATSSASTNTTPATSCSSTGTSSCSDRRLFGNVGHSQGRHACDVDGFHHQRRGRTRVRVRSKRVNDYTDDLPSLNVAYQITDDLHRCARGWAKVMARPLLNNLAPSITGLTTPTAPARFGIADHRQPVARAVPREELSTSASNGISRRAACCRWRCSRRTFPTTRRRCRPRGRMQDVARRRRRSRRSSQTQTPRSRRWLHRRRWRRPALRHPAVPGRAGRRDQGLRDQLPAGPHVPAGLPEELRRAGELHATHLGAAVHPRSGLGGAAGARRRSRRPARSSGASPKSANFTLYYETPKWSARVSWAYRDRLRDARIRSPRAPARRD